MEVYMECIYGVKDVIFGYVNGNMEKISYQLIGLIDYVEMVKVIYDVN